MKKYTVLILFILTSLMLFAQFPSKITKFQNGAFRGWYPTDGTASNIFTGRGYVYDTLQFDYLDSLWTLRFQDGTKLTSANLNYIQNATNMFAFGMSDGQRKLVRSVNYYINDTATFNGIKTVGNNYYRNPNVIVANDTMYLTVASTKGHEFTQGSQRLIKYAKCGVAFSWGTMPCARAAYQYTNQISDKAIPYENLTLAPNLINGKFYGVQYKVTYTSDTILVLDYNFNRDSAIYFDKTASHVQSSFLSLSKIIQDDSGYFYMAGYERPGDNYIGVLLRTVSPNTITSWDTIKKFPFVDNQTRLEECAVWRGDGDTIIFAARNDFGNRTMIAKCIYGQCSNILSFYRGCNQPKGLSYSDSMIVGTGRIFGFPSLDGEIQTLNDTLRHNETFNYRAYTTFSVSWDYGNNWNVYYVDRIRTEAMGVGGIAQYQPLTSEVADVVQIANDTFRIYWASGVYVDNVGGDYGDLNYADFVINRYQRGDVRFIGGITKQQTTYNTSIKVDSLVITDTAYDKWMSIDIDNTVANFNDNVDTVRFYSNVKMSNSLSLGTAELESGRGFDFRNSTGNEQFTGLGGNIRYRRFGTGAPSFRLGQTDGTYAFKTSTTINRGLGDFSFGGYLSGDVANFNMGLTAAENFTSTSNLGSNLAFTKYYTGSASPAIFYFNDSINRQWWGRSTTRPAVLTHRFNFDGNFKIEQNNVTAFTSDSGYIYVPNTPVSVASTDTLLAIDANGKVLGVPKSYINSIAKAYVDSSSGYISYSDTNIKRNKIFPIGQDSSKILPFRYTSSLTKDKPLGRDSMYSNADTGICLRDGDSFLTRLSFSAKGTTSAIVFLEVSLYINGTQGFVFSTMVPIAKGTNWQNYSAVITGFAGTTFEANKGKIYFKAIGGDVQIGGFDFYNDGISDSGVGLTVNLLSRDNK